MQSCHVISSRLVDLRTWILYQNAAGDRDQVSFHYRNHGSRLGKFRRIAAAGVFLPKHTARGLQMDAGSRFRVAELSVRPIRSAIHSLLDQDSTGAIQDRHAHGLVFGQVCDGGNSAVRDGVRGREIEGITGYCVIAHGRLI